MTRTLTRHAVPAPRLRVTDSGNGVALIVKLLPFMFVCLMFSYGRFNRLHSAALWVVDAMDVGGVLTLAAFDGLAVLNWRLWGERVMTTVYGEFWRD